MYKITSIFFIANFLFGLSYAGDSFYRERKLYASPQMYQFKFKNDTYTVPEYLVVHKNGKKLFSTNNKVRALDPNEDGVYFYILEEVIFLQVVSANGEDPALVNFLMLDQAGKVRRLSELEDENHKYFFKHKAKFCFWKKSFCQIENMKKKLKKPYIMCFSSKADQFEIERDKVEKGACQSTAQNLSLIKNEVKWSSATVVPRKF